MWFIFPSGADMNEKNDFGSEVVRNVLLATDLDDYNIPWGDRTEWKQRTETAPSEANEPLATLALYWKYAWHNARSPHTTMNLVENAVMNLVEAAERGEAENIAKTLWKELLTTDEFKLSVLGSQVLAYSAFYFGYEHFLTECCAIRLNTDADELMGYAIIREAVASAFITSIEADVWSSTSIEVARRARNALVHNG